MRLEQYKVEEVLRYPTNGLTGRFKIKTTVRKITRDNVREVLEKALALHAANAAQITYLYEYYKGNQDIREKQKFVRENINNKVMVNRANEIVTFKSAYRLNEPIMYISMGDSDAVTKGVLQLNDFMRMEDKESKDKEVVDWTHICGVADRLVLTDEMANVEDGAPFYIYTIDPRDAFVIYSAAVGERPMAGVIIQRDENDELYYMVYTENRCFTVYSDGRVEEEAHILGGIPLVEYINNEARMGAFETVIPILNAINQLESDSVDNVQDFVNGFDVFQNCDIDDGEYSQLSIGGKAIRVKTVVQGMEAKVYRVASELSQSGVQQRVDDLTDAYLTICGMPNRNGGSSTSDTGQAVIFRDGWSEAESRAKDSEKLFTRSERQFLRIVLNICEVKAPLGLKLHDVGINYARKSLNNLQSRFQCFMEGLNSDRLAPKLIFDAFGDIFGDKNSAYIQSMKWREEQEAKEEEEIRRQLEEERLRVTNGANGGSDENETGGENDVTASGNGNEGGNGEQGIASGVQSERQGNRQNQ